MKKKIISLALVICTLALLATGTAAYFTADGTATNVFTTGKIDVAVVETTLIDGEELPYEEILEDGKLAVMPATVVSKIVKVEGQPECADAYIRAKADVAIELASDTDGDFSPNLDLIIIGFNESDWTYNEDDGWYYYNGTIKAGEKTKQLFDTVTFSPDMGNEYQNSTATIAITAQAVQAKNNGASALAAQGWPSVGEE